MKLLKINRLLWPVLQARADDKPLGWTQEECIRRLAARHPDTGKSALRTEPLPPCDDTEYQLDIIIPAYNVEAQLAGCMQSVLGQKSSYPFRVILVEDGATDRTAEIANRFAGIENVQVIHQQNAGAAHARNTGLAASCAPYLMFVDADDRLAPDAIQKLMDCITAQQADAAEGSYYNENGKTRRLHKQQEGLLPSMNALYGMPWGKVYRRELFEKVCFPEGYWFEDSVLHQLVLPCAGVKYGICDVVYERGINPQGAGYTSRGNAKSIDTVWLALRLAQDRQQLGLRADQDYFEYLLNLAVLSAHRLQGLDEEVQQAAFGVFAHQLNTLCPGFAARTEQRKALETALRSKQYAKFRCWCDWLG